jgi:hypothetical protein
MTSLATVTGRGSQLLAYRLTELVYVLKTQGSLELLTNTNS